MLGIETAGSMLHPGVDLTEGNPESHSVVTVATDWATVHD